MKCRHYDLLNLRERYSVREVKKQAEHTGWQGMKQGNGERGGNRTINYVATTRTLNTHYTSTIPQPSTYFNLLGLRDE